MAYIYTYTKTESEKGIHVYMDTVIITNQRVIELFFEDEYHFEESYPNCTVQKMIEIAEYYLKQHKTNCRWKYISKPVDDMEKKILPKLKSLNKDDAVGIMETRR